MCSAPAIAIPTNALEDELAKAEQSGELREILVATRKLQDAQPTQGRKERIAGLEIAMMVVDAETALADGRPGGAASILDDIIARDPNNADAKRMISQLANARMKQEAERQGDQLVSQGKYQEAIGAFQKALTFGPDTNGSINEKIKNAAGRVHLAASEKALAQGDIVTAQERIEKARVALGDTDAIEDLEARIEELRAYTLLIEEGDTFFTNDEFGKAKAKYLDAKKIFDSQAINTKIKDCDFNSWLQQCDGHILRREWDAAVGALNQAEQIKTNDQTRARREQINNRVQ